MQSYYIIFEKQKYGFIYFIFCVKKLKKRPNPPRFAVTLHVTALQFSIFVCVTCHVTNLNFPDSITVLFYFYWFHRCNTPEKIIAKNFGAFIKSF